VLELCLYAHRLAEGALDGEPAEYLPGRAEQYVREQRMPAELFRAHAHLPDEELAEEFNVPVWEVAARRQELHLVTGLARPRSPRRDFGRSSRRAAVRIGERPRPKS
jgi:hypothetical protein